MMDESYAQLSYHDLDTLPVESLRQTVQLDILLAIHPSLSMIANEALWHFVAKYLSLRSMPLR